MAQTTAIVSREIAGKESESCVRALQSWAGFPNPSMSGTRETVSVHPTTRPRLAGVRHISNSFSLPGLRSFCSRSVCDNEFENVFALPARRKAQAAVGRVAADASPGRRGRSVGPGACARSVGRAGAHVHREAYKV